MERLERIDKIDVSTFVARYVAANRPVIVTDAMSEWPAREKWTPSYFRERFGTLSTQIYDNLFTLLGVRPLRDYIDGYLGKQGESPDGAYVRWYVKFKHIDFCWSDGVFSELADDWSHPYFLPTSSYVMPFCRTPGGVLANRDTFPYKGLFVSSRGARTRLHREIGRAHV